MAFETRKRTTADWVLQPDTDRLVLSCERRKDDSRNYNLSLINRQPVGVEGANIEGMLVWESWHGGDGFGEIMERGAAPPYTAYGTLDCRNPGHMLLGPLLSTVAAQGINKLQHFNGRVWGVGTMNSFADNALYKFTQALAVDVGYPTTNAGSFGTRSAANWCYGLTEFDSVLYIGMGFNVAAHYVDTSSAITAGATANDRFKWIVKSLERAYINAKPAGATSPSNIVRSFSSGLAAPAGLANANWSGVTYIGDQGRNITGLSAQFRPLFVGKTDGLNSLTPELETSNLLPEISAFLNNTNGFGMTHWLGGILMPTIRGLYWYSDGLTTPVGPEVQRNNTTRFRGRARCFAPDGEWVWAIFETSPPDAGVYYVYQLAVARRRREDDGGTSPLVWYQLGEWTDDSAGLSGFLSNIDLQMCIYPLGDVNYLVMPRTDSAIQFTQLSSLINSNDLRAGYRATSGYKVLPKTHCGQPLVKKLFRAVEIRARGLSATSTITISYSIDPTGNPTSWTTLVAPVVNNGVSRLVFPTNTTGHDIMIRIDMAQAVGAAASPDLMRLALFYTELHDQNRIWPLSVTIGTHDPMRGGTSIQQNTIEILSKLLSYTTSNMGTITVVTPWGERISCVLLNLKIREQSDGLTDSDMMTMVADFVLVEVGR